MKIHTFLWHLPRDKKRAPREHEHRDASAAGRIVATMVRDGWEFGEEILNMPPPNGDDADPQHRIIDVDLSFVAPGDILLEATRPPLDDRLQSNRKQVERGYTDVEERLLGLWRNYFAVCSRMRLVLSESVSRLLPAAYADRACIEFREQKGAPFKRLGKRGAKRGTNRARTPRATTLFLLRVDEAWPGGPGLISAFGMDGVSTLIWAKRLATDFHHLLDRRGLTMAELALGEFAERPTDLRWCRDWAIEECLFLPLEQQVPLKRAAKAAPKRERQQGS